MLTQAPKNYVYKRLDVSDNFYHKRYNACQFVDYMCKYRKKEKGKKKSHYPYFNNFYKYFISILNMYEEQKKNGGNPDLRIKEAVLEILTKLAIQIEE